MEIIKKAMLLISFVFITITYSLLLTNEDAYASTTTSTSTLTSEITTTTNPKSDKFYYSNKADGYIIYVVIIAVVAVIIKLCIDSRNRKFQKDQRKDFITKDLIAALKEYYAVYENQKDNIPGQMLNKQISAEAFDIFKIVEIASTKFDYKTLEENLTDELFNNYKMQLDVLKNKNERKAIDELEYRGGYIVDIDMEMNKISMGIEIRVFQKKYIIDEQNNYVKGNKDLCKRKYYIRLFRTIDILSKCPNCGAEITDAGHQTCPHCDTVVTQNISKFKISKIEEIIGD